MSFFAAIKKIVGINNVYDNHTTKDHFNVSLGDRFGPLPNPSCIAYDSHNNILAVGSAQGGIVKVYGRPGAEQTLWSGNRGVSISSLTFVPDTGNLLVTSDRVLEVFNLSTSSIDAVLRFDAPITCVSYYPTCAFVYVGLVTGDVNVVNVDRWALSLYKINSKDLEVPPGSTSRSIVSIAINPDRDDIILLGIACGSINEWEIKTSKVLRRYLSDKPLCSVVWDPSGNKMLAGHANGELVLWTRKKSIADEVYHPVVNPQKPSPIKRLFWVAPKSTSSDTSTVTLGGTDFPNGLVIEHLKQKKRVFVPLAQPGVELRDACVIFASPSLTSSSSSTGSSGSAGSASVEPSAVVAVDAHGNIYCHAIYGEVDERMVLPSINAPLPFSLANVTVLASLAVSDLRDFLQDLIAAGNIDPNDAMKGQTSALAWPLMGGMFAVDPHNMPVVLITLMSNNTVIFWDVSMRNCRVPIYRIRLPGMINAATNLVFDFCPISRILHVGNNHEVFVYHFSHEARSIPLTTIDDAVLPTQVQSATLHISQKALQKPRLSPTNSALAMNPQAPNSSASSATTATPTEMAPKSIVLDEAPPTPPTTRASETPSSPRSQPSGTQAVSPSPALGDSSGSASSASGNGPSTPQKQPSKSPVSPQAQNGSTTSNGATAPQTTPSVPSSPSSSQLNPPTSPVRTQAMDDVVPQMPASAAAGPKRVAQTPMPTQEAGFQFVYSISLDGKPIQCLNYESGLQLLAVSTTDGRVRVLKSSEEYSRTFVYNPPANTLPCPPIVTHLQFCESVVDNQDHLLLIMGMDLGSVHAISLTQPSRVFKPIAARKSPVIDIHLVHHRGDQFKLSKKPWLRNAGEGPNWAYAPSHSKPKHLIVCTVNDVRTYKVPELEMEAQYECSAPIAWFGTINVNVEVDGKLEREYVLAAIDMGSNVLFIRLMNLTLVSYAGPNNLTRMGVPGISPMTTTRSCNLLDGTLFLHTDANETHIIKLLPFNERRAVTKLVGPDPPKPIAKRSKGLKGLIGKDKDVNFEEVFGPRKEDPSQAASSASSSSGNPKAPPKPVSSPARNQGQINDVKSVMSDNIDRLNQRGEKLSDLADRSSQMADASHSFATLAKQLADQQKKSWF
jgi:hypothetical protein